MLPNNMTSRFSARAVVTLKSAKTAEGASVQFSVRGKSAFVNESKIVKTDIGAGNGPDHRFAIGDIARHDCCPDASKPSEVAGRPHEQANVVAAVDKPSRQSAPEKSGRAGDEDTHVDPLGRAVAESGDRR